MTTAPALTEWVQIMPLHDWAVDPEVRNAAAPEHRARLPKGWAEQCREEYDLYVMVRYLAAEEATVGYFLNDRGRAAPSLQHGDMFERPWRQVRCYASEELLAWVEANGETLTYTDFRAQYRAGVEVMG